MTRGLDLTGVIVPDDWAAVAALLTNRSLPPRLRERLEMVKAAYHGAEVEAIVRWSGRTDETVRRWLRVFGEGGLDALADAPRSGRPVRADAAYLAALETAVDTDPRTLELAFDVWTSARLSAYLAETTGTRIAPGWLRVLLHRQRFANGRPKHSVAHLQDPVEVAACVERLREVGGKGAGRSGAVRAAL
ncbi:MAG: helix-turn-helix domain-containing protein [Chloroflexota bacterium]|nr:helix-turn-helix domain-containing protein [Chloroflexota bacterium]